MSDNPDAQGLVDLAKRLRHVLDPWVRNDMPVGPSTRIRRQYLRSLSLTEHPIVSLVYVKKSGRDPNGWELKIPQGEPVLFLPGKRSDEEAIAWADDHLRLEGWIFVEA